MEVYFMNLFEKIKAQRYWIGILSLAMLVACGRGNEPEKHAETPRDKNDISPQIAKAFLFPETGKGIGHFTFKGVPDIHFTIPRKYLAFDPNEPDGETDSLIFSFYLPDWIARSDLPRSWSKKERGESEVNATIRSTRGFTCWGGQCDGIAYVLFQRAIEEFQTARPDPYQEVPTCLHNGKQDDILNLVAYEGKSELVPAQGKSTIYLEKDANPCYAKKWIKCEGYGCEQITVKKGLALKLTYWRRNLTHHAEYEAGFNRKINEFTNSNLLP